MKHLSAYRLSFRARSAAARRAAASNARVAWPTAGNETFAVLKGDDAKRLRAASAAFYEWPEPHGYDAGLASGEEIVRLVTAFSTQPGDVDAFLAALRG